MGPWFFCSFNSLTPSTLSLFSMSSNYMIACFLRNSMLIHADTAWFVVHDNAYSSHHSVPPFDISALFHPNFIYPFQYFKSNTLSTWTSIISISLGSTCNVGLYFIPKGQITLVSFFLLIGFLVDRLLRICFEY